MLLTFVVTNLIVAVAANPFHKYPYVFLLDVGNEEIQNTLPEQIRVSIPGGSLALKYPAIPGSDTIAHVRVSGIDFGTDLKANIIDGGPGSNYVVLMFNGKSDVTYDAVITIDFVRDPTDINIDDDDDDKNDSSEDISELDSDGAFSEKQSKEELVASSKVYYANDGVVDSKYKDEQIGDSDTVEDSNSNESESDENFNDKQQYDEQSEDNDSPGVKSNEMNSNDVRSKYVSYVSFRPRLYGGVRIYPQAGLYVDDFSRAAYDSVSHDSDDNAAYDDSRNKFIDANNNIKLGYSLAME